MLPAWVVLSVRWIGFAIIVFPSPRAADEPPTSLRIPIASEDAVGVAWWEALLAQTCPEAAG